MVAAGTKVALALTSPVWAKSVQLSDSIYTETVFPVTVDNRNRLTCVQR